MILTKIRKVLEEIKKSALFTGTLAANAEQAMDSQGQLNISKKTWQNWVVFGKWVGLAN